MQVCTSLQVDNHASTLPLSFFTGRMPFLPPNQQRQSTEGNNTSTKVALNDTFTEVNKISVSEVQCSCAALVSLETS